MQINDANKVLEKIKKETNKSQEEIEQEIQKIKDKYQGLLSDVGAHIMYAKKLGINLDVSSTNSLIKISDLSTSQDGISLYARINSILPKKHFNLKDGSTGVIQPVFIYDDTSRTKLNLWQENAELVDSLNLEKNSLILIKNGYVSQYKDRLEISLRKGGSIEKDPKDAPEIPYKKQETLYPSDVSDPKEDLVTLIGRIINIFEIKEFEDKNQRKRFVLNFQVSDGVKTIKCTAWDEWAKIIKNDFSRDDIVKINDVNIKEGLYDLEANINWNSTVKKNPKIKKTLPKASEVLDTNYNKEKIENIEQDKYYELEGLIVSINRNKLRYFKCPECNSKLQPIDNEFICETCNKTVTPNINLLGSIDIDDSTGIIKVVFFRDLVTKLFNLNKEMLNKELTEDQLLEIFDNLEDQLLGKKIKIQGKANFNDFSSQIEVIANELEIIE